MIADPYETNNLYNTDNNAIEIQKNLYTLIDLYSTKFKVPITSEAQAEECFNVWKGVGGFMIPWINPGEIGEVFSNPIKGAQATYPEYCGLLSNPTIPTSSSISTTSTTTTDVVVVTTPVVESEEQEESTTAEVSVDTIEVKEDEEKEEEVTVTAGKEDVIDSATTVTSTDVSTTDKVVTPLPEGPEVEIENPTVSTVVELPIQTPFTLPSVSSGSFPNFVFILADDVGYHSINENITPFLSNLQDKGVKLTKYYSQETCTPSRAALLTGRFPITVGWQKYEQSAMENSGLNLDETTLAEVLKQYGGYTNYIFGKWNLGNASPRFLPTARGFDTFLGFLDGSNYYWSKTNPTYSEYIDFMSADTKCYNVYDNEDMNEYSTILYKNKAIDAIENHDFDKSSMFMYLSFQAAQNPFGGKSFTILYYNF